MSSISLLSLELGLKALRQNVRTDGNNVRALAQTVGALVESVRELAQTVRISVNRPLVLSRLTANCLCTFSGGRSQILLTSV